LNPGGSRQPLTLGCQKSSKGLPAKSSVSFMKKRRTLKDKKSLGTCRVEGDF